jgi:hypothetical protein
MRLGVARTKKQDDMARLRPLLVHVCHTFSRVKGKGSGSPILSQFAGKQINSLGQSRCDLPAGYPLPASRRCPFLAVEYRLPAATSALSVIAVRVTEVIQLGLIEGDNRTVGNKNVTAALAQAFDQARHRRLIAGRRRIRR